ncbi:MAG: hypothetical protein ACYCO9_21625 [Streptosporangiaceae bacterium]
MTDRAGQTWHAAARRQAYRIPVSPSHPPGSHAARDLPAARRAVARVYDNPGTRRQADPTPTELVTFLDTVLMEADGADTATSRDRLRPVGEPS